MIDPTLAKWIVYLALNAAWVAAVLRAKRNQRALW